MFEEALRSDTLARLDALVRDGVVRGFYLGGGTAVALHLGHRVSEDLDFFTPEADRIEGAHAFLTGRGALILKKTAGSATGAWEGVRVSFLTYPYPLLEEVRLFRGCPVAGLRDLALMKITAIADRGKRRDFLDLYAICARGYSLRQLLLEDMGRKFAGVSFSLAHYVKSLVYFADADRDEEPLRLLHPVDWEAVKAFFRAEVRALA